MSGEPCLTHSRKVATRLIPLDVSAGTDVAPQLQIPWRSALRAAARVDITEGNTESAIKFCLTNIEIKMLFPRPRVLFLISLALAIPTYGASLAIFYFIFKRPYDSSATSLILATAKSCLETGRDGELFHVN